MVSGLSRAALVDGVARAEGLAVHELSPAGSPGAGSGRDRRWFVPMTARPIPRALAQLRHRATTDREGSPGRAVPGVPVVVHGIILAAKCAKTTTDDSNREDGP